MGIGVAEKKEVPTQYLPKTCVERTKELHHPSKTAGTGAIIEDNNTLYLRGSHLYLLYSENNYS